ncbi:sulfur carrier protein ThiS [Spirosoma aureum]|uniref:Sulfur carrier protein ThiS n=1 Tax=Spirosoma aureum TaxID=2692134 RepID=A0A6G9AQ39_9BACT|nr:sulfur carrier protein ThiS [Spirosoma aureum]QIP14601.1 sulfur carrier protein ThiS [Spirosoma aureum]
MLVSVNNQSVEMPSAASLGSLLNQLALADQKGIAVAVNNTIVSRMDWSQYILSGNDKVTILQATQGG